LIFVLREAPNGLRYLRWGGRRNAVRTEKCSGVGKCLKMAQNPQRQVHALLARTGERKARRQKTKTTPLTDLILHALQFFTSLTLILENTTDVPKRRAENLPKPLPKIDFAKSGLCQKKTNLTKKPEPNLPTFLLKILKPISET